MNSINYDNLNLDELREYVLTYREDTTAFYAYIDRSKVNGRMITVDLEDNHWEENINRKIQDEN
ncbi:MAG: hypothetical protein AAGF26_15790 [Cyanobacteria bacterium P01_G01_bin.49]